VADAEADHNTDLP
jgi:structural maintenance of chromosome 2